MARRQSFTPALVHDVIMQVGHYKMNFICNPIHVLLETFAGQGV